MTADKRSTITDALETLGTKPIPADSGRDAIHLAVEPVVAGETLYSGQRIGIENGVAIASDNTLGIVDPFLPAPVSQGEMFWLVVYPRKITSLRHVWDHPSFPPEASLLTDTISESEQWLRNYADELDEHLNTLMGAADDWLEDGEYFLGAPQHGYHGKFEGLRTHPEFWKHYAAYTGKDVPEDKAESFFTCSC